MAAEVADKGAAPACGELLVLELLSGLSEGRRVDGLGEGVEVARAHLVEGEEDLVAEVVDQGVGRAASAQGATSLLLARAEEALQLVGRRRQVGIIEAVEEVGPVAARDGDEMVDEGGGLGVEAQAGRCALELTEEVPELGLRLGGVLRTVLPVGCGADVVSYVSKVLHVPVDPAGGADLVPVERQGLFERIKAGRGHGDAGGGVFFAAFSTVSRTCSRR